MAILMGLAAHDGASAAKRAVPMLPDRILACDLGHATNADATRDQAESEIIFDSRHVLSVHLPSIPVRTTEPPEAIDPPEPVAKGTGIIADPDGIAADVTGPVRRVVDLWPDRVELSIPMQGIEKKLIIINGVNEAAGRARLFMTDAKDLATFNMQRIYAGNCLVTITPPKGKSS